MTCLLRLFFRDIRRHDPRRPRRTRICPSRSCARLAKLDLPGYTILSEKIRRSASPPRNSMSSLIKKEQPARHLSDIQKIMNGSALSSAIKQKSLKSSSALPRSKRRSTERRRRRSTSTKSAPLTPSWTSGFGHRVRTPRITEIIGSPVNVGSRHGPHCAIGSCRCPRLPRRNC